MISFTCSCCGFTDTKEDEDAFFQAGWDTPKHFAAMGDVGLVACNLCPSAYLVMGNKEKHDPVHERWEKEGRPEEFSQETCVPEDERIDEGVLQAMMKAMLKGDLETAFAIVKEHGLTEEPEPREYPPDLN